MAASVFDPTSSARSEDPGTRRPLGGGVGRHQTSLVASDSEDFDNVCESYVSTSFLERGEVALTEGKRLLLPLMSSSLAPPITSLLDIPAESLRVSLHPAPVTAPSLMPHPPSLFPSPPLSSLAPPPSTPLRFDSPPPGFPSDPSLPIFFNLRSASSIPLPEVVNELQLADFLRDALGTLAPSARLLDDGSLFVRATSVSQSRVLSRLSALGPAKLISTPDSALNSSQGTIFAPRLSNIPAPEILAHLRKNSIPVSNVYRFPPRPHTHESSNPRLLLSFSTPFPPTTILLGFGQYSVRQHIPPPRRCTKCQRLGHPQKYCKSPSTNCPNCSQSPAHADCSLPPLCINCNGPHPASAPACPAYLAEKRVKSIMVLEKTTRREALSRVRRSTPTPGLSYASALSSSPIASAVSRTPPPVPVSSSQPSSSPLSLSNRFHSLIDHPDSHSSSSLSPATTVLSTATASLTGPLPTSLVVSSGAARTVPPVSSTVLTSSSSTSSTSVTSSKHVSSPKKTPAPRKSPLAAELLSGKGESSLSRPGADATGSLTGRPSRKSSRSRTSSPYSIRTLAQPDSPVSHSVSPSSKRRKNSSPLLDSSPVSHSRSRSLSPMDSGPTDSPPPSPISDEPPLITLGSDLSQIPLPPGKSLIQDYPPPPGYSVSTDSSTLRPTYIALTTHPPTSTTTHSSPSPDPS